MTIIVDKTSVKEPTQRILQIVETLKSLGGCARTADIYQEYERLYWWRTGITARQEDSGRPNTWQPGLRNAMQRHNADSKQYISGNASLFLSPARGVWALRTGKAEVVPLDLAA